MNQRAIARHNAHHEAANAKRRHTRCAQRVQSRLPRGPRIPMAGYLTPELDSRSRLGSTRTTLSRRRGAGGGSTLVILCMRVHMMNANPK